MRRARCQEREACQCVLPRPQSEGTRSLGPAPSGGGESACRLRSEVRCRGHRKTRRPAHEGLPARPSCSTFPGEAAVEDTRLAATEPVVLRALLVERLGCLRAEVIWGGCRAAARRAPRHRTVGLPRARAEPEGRPGDGLEGARGAWGLGGACPVRGSRRALTALTRPDRAAGGSAIRPPFSVACRAKASEPAASWSLSGVMPATDLVVMRWLGRGARTLTGRPVIRPARRPLP